MTNVCEPYELYKKKEKYTQDTHIDTNHWTFSLRKFR